MNKFTWARLPRAAFLSSLGLALMLGCTSTAEDAEPTAGAEQALTAEALSVTCKTLGAIGECWSASQCQGNYVERCRVKSAAPPGSIWPDLCRRQGSERECKAHSDYCGWETAYQCTPRSGAYSDAPPNIEITCKTMGELGSCTRINACRRQTDASGPTCRPAGPGPAELALGTMCTTLGALSSCYDISGVCSSRWENKCVVKPDLAGDDFAVRVCRELGTSESACNDRYCDWKLANSCTPVTGADPDAKIDPRVMCETVGQLGKCSRVTLCRSVNGTCRPIGG